MSGSFLSLFCSMHCISTTIHVFVITCTSTCAQVDLKKLGIMDYGELESGQLADCANDKLELFFPHKVLKCSVPNIQDSSFFSHTYKCIDLQRVSFCNYSVSIPYLLFLQYINESSANCCLTTHVIIEVAVWHMGVVLKPLSCNHTTTFNKHCSSGGQGSHALHTLPIACISSTLSESSVLQCFKHSNTIKIHNRKMLDLYTRLWGGRTIWLGGLPWEAAKQPIIRVKCPRAKVKNWGG